MTNNVMVDSNVAGVVSGSKTWAIVCGNALDVLKSMPSNCVQCVCTSPPYYNLRDYGHQGQIGLESTPGEYVSSLISVFGELSRVLKNDGVLWLNLGDTYSSGCMTGMQGKTSTSSENMGQGKETKLPSRRTVGIPPKNLIGMPWRVAFGLQEAGWYLRSEIIWHKRSVMPESVTSRPTRCHENIFLLSSRYSNGNYYYDYKSIVEPLAVSTIADKRFGDEDLVKSKRTKNYGGRPDTFTYTPGCVVGNIEGRNKRSVWEVNNTGFSGAHFAVWPTALVEPMIKAGSKHNDIVMDPFCGSGTTGLVARRLGRKFIGIDISPKYCEMSGKRIYEDSPLFNT